MIRLLQIKINSMKIEKENIVNLIREKIRQKVEILYSKK